MKISLELCEVHIYKSLLIPKICSYSIMLPAHVVGRNNNLVEQLWTNIDDSGNRCADGKGRKEVSRSVLPHIKNIPYSSIGPLPPPPLWESPLRQPYKRGRRRIACRVLLLLLEDDMVLSLYWDVLFVTAELKMDVLREREVKDSLERQLMDEQKIRGKRQNLQSNNSH